jgi:hypothetical protein
VFELQLKLWLYSIRRVFGPARPPYPPGSLERLHAAGDISGMVSELKSYFNLEMQFRVGRVSSGGLKGHDMWVKMPLLMPPRHTALSRNLTIDIMVRRTFLQRAPAEVFVVTLAHEFGHVMLNSCYHEFREEERVVDLTAMHLGFRDYFVQYSEYDDYVSTPWADYRVAGEMGYLSAQEREYAARLITIGG